MTNLDKFIAEARNDNSRLLASVSSAIKDIDVLHESSKQKDVFIDLLCRELSKTLDMLEVMQVGILEALSLGEATPCADRLKEALSRVEEIAEEV